MTDRELLELAAKAASIKLPHMVEIAAGEYVRYWNPLDDDGDAFRLAVTLGMKIEQGEGCVVVWVDFIGTGFINYEGDPLRANRLAIVRAAAEIGEAMP